jgi:hypothetical protein
MHSGSTKHAPAKARGAAIDWGRRLMTAKAPL